MGNPIPQNHIYGNVKLLLERVAPVMIDKAAIQVLMDYIEDGVRGVGEITEEVPHATENGMKLLKVKKEAILNMKIKICLKFQVSKFHFHKNSDPSTPIFPILFPINFIGILISYNYKKTPIFPIFRQSLAQFWLLDIQSLTDLAGIHQKIML